MNTDYLPGPIQIMKTAPTPMEKAGMMVRLLEQHEHIHDASVRDAIEKMMIDLSRNPYLAQS